MVVVVVATMMVVVVVVVALVVAGLQSRLCVMVGARARILV